MSEEGDAPAPAKPPPRLVDITLGGLCPRCGEATLYAGVLRFADRCGACGLDISTFNVGDGPAAFLTLGVGTIVTVLALVVELAFAPSVWLHVALWPAITLAAVVGGLRLTKAALLAAEYRNAAREGRIVR